MAKRCHRAVGLRLHPQRGEGRLLQQRADDRQAAQRALPPARGAQDLRPAAADRRGGLPPPRLGPQRGRGQRLRPRSPPRSGRRDRHHPGALRLAGLGTARVPGLLGDGDPHPLQGGVLQPGLGVQQRLRLRVRGRPRRRPAYFLRGRPRDVLAEGRAQDRRPRPGSWPPRDSTSPACWHSTSWRAPTGPPGTPKGRARCCQGL